MNREEITKAIEKASLKHGFEITFHEKGENNPNIYQTEVYDCIVIFSKEKQSSIVVGFDDDNKWDEEKVYISNEKFVGAYAPELIESVIFDENKMTFELKSYQVSLSF